MMNSLAARDGMAESHTEIPEGDLCASHAYHNSKALKEYSSSRRTERVRLAAKYDRILHDNPYTSKRILNTYSVESGNIGTLVL